MAAAQRLIRPHLFLPVLFGQTYPRKLLNLFGASIIAYWPLWEPSGATANDISGNGRNGAYTGVTLGQPGIGDGHTAPLFDGATDYCNIYSTSLRDAFDPAEGTILLWVKPFNAGVWTDGIGRTPCRIGVDGSSNLLGIQKPTTNNNLTFQYVAGGTGSSFNIAGQSFIAWTHLALTWSLSSGASGEFKGYIAGSQAGSTQTGLGTWAGLPAATRCNLGATITTPAAVWNGWLAHAILLDRPATLTEIAAAAKV